MKELEREMKEMIAYIDCHKACFGIEPICNILPIAPRTYYAQRVGPVGKEST